MYKLEKNTAGYTNYLARQLKTCQRPDTAGPTIIQIFKFTLFTFYSLNS